MMSQEGQVCRRTRRPDLPPGTGSSQMPRVTLDGAGTLRAEGSTSEPHSIACLQNRGKVMLFASKIACSGIVFLLMTPWISGPPPTPVDSGIDRSSEVPEETPSNDVQGMQQTLQDEGHYRGKIDGVFCLRTRASIRELQKAENLPVTGQLDVQTASKLGVKPESREDRSDDATQDKPSAGVAWADGSRRSGRTLRKPAKKQARTVPPTLASSRPLERAR